MIVLRTQAPAPIRWQCSACDDEGVISNWEDSPFDRRRRRPILAETAREIVLPDEVAATLRGLQLLDRDCERLASASAPRSAPHHPRRHRRLPRRADRVRAVEASNEPSLCRSGSDSMPHSTRSAPWPTVLTAGDPMALPELDIARVQRWCAARVPEHARYQVRVECQVAPRHLTIVERRAPWRDDYGPEWTSFPIARLRLHRRRQVLDLVLARSPPPFPYLRPARAVESH